MPSLQRLHSVGRAKVITMTFTIPGLDPWCFRLILVGQHLILEAMRGEMTLSMEINPLDSRISRAHELLSHPSCAMELHGF